MKTILAVLLMGAYGMIGRAQSVPTSAPEVHQTTWELTGTVTNEKNIPMAGVKVCIGGIRMDNFSITHSTHSLFNCYITTHTSEIGKFVFSSLPDHNYYGKLFVFGEGYAVVSHAIEFKHEKRIERNFKLIQKPEFCFPSWNPKQDPKDQLISGTVRHKNGVPIPGAAVFLDTGGGRKAIETGKDGTYKTTIYSTRIFFYVNFMRDQYEEFYCPKVIEVEDHLNRTIDFIMD